jgi:hypothetical protein
METPFKTIKCSEYLFMYLGEMPSKRQEPGNLTSNDTCTTRPYQRPYQVLDPRRQMPSPPANGSEIEHTEAPKLAKT